MNAQNKAKATQDFIETLKHITENSTNYARKIVRLEKRLKKLKTKFIKREYIRKIKFMLLRNQQMERDIELEQDLDCEIQTLLQKENLNERKIYIREIREPMVCNLKTEDVAQRKESLYKNKERDTEFLNKLVKSLEKYEATESREINFSGFN